jgi:hypothetical protein
LKKTSSLWATTLAILLLPAAGRAQGGPPMITDDPDTPGNKNWEINAADIAVMARTQVLNFVPYLDINYGLGDRIQLKIEGGYGLERDLGSRVQSGPGPILLGVKWRFWDQEKDGGLSISMYPQFSFHPTYASKDPDIAPAGNFWMLPIEFSKRFGPFAVNPEIGYMYFTRPQMGDLDFCQAADAWFYGVVGAYEPQKDLEFLAELHGDTLVQGGADDLLFNIGARFPFDEKVLLIASAGHTIKTLPGVPPQYLAYLGFQFRL